MESLCEKITRLIQKDMENAGVSKYWFEDILESKLDVLAEKLVKLLDEEK